MTGVIPSNKRKQDEIVFDTTYIYPCSKVRKIVEYGITDLPADVFRLILNNLSPIDWFNLQRTYNKRIFSWCNSYVDLIHKKCVGDLKLPTKKYKNLVDLYEVVLFLQQKYENISYQKKIKLIIERALPSLKLAVILNQNIFRDVDEDKTPMAVIVENPTNFSRNWFRLTTALIDFGITLRGVDTEKNNYLHFAAGLKTLRENTHEHLVSRNILYEDEGTNFWSKALASPESKTLLTQKNKDGQTPLFIALVTKKYELAAAMIKAGAALPDLSFNYDEWKKINLGLEAYFSFWKFVLKDSHLPLKDSQKLELLLLALKNNDIVLALRCIRAGAIVPDNLGEKFEKNRWVFAFYTKTLGELEVHFKKLLPEKEVLPKLIGMKAIKKAEEIEMEWMLDLLLFHEGDVYRIFSNVSNDKIFQMVLDFDCIEMFQLWMGYKPDITKKIYFDKSFSHTYWGTFFKSFSCTIFHFLIQEGKIEWIKACCKHPEINRIFNEQNSEDWPELFYACRLGHFEIVKVILTNKTKLAEKSNLQESKEWTVLLDATTLVCEAPKDNQALSNFKHAYEDLECSEVARSNFLKAHEGLEVSEEALSNFQKAYKELFLLKSAR